jgi:hypothetical protein
MVATYSVPVHPVTFRMISPPIHVPDLYGTGTGSGTVLDQFRRNRFHIHLADHRRGNRALVAKQSRGHVSDYDLVDFLSPFEKSGIFQGIGCGIRHDIPEIIL